MFCLLSSLILLLVGHVASHPGARHKIKEQKLCTVIPLGAPKNDVPQILKAFEECNNGGRVIFPPGQTYRIAEKVKVNIQNVEIDWSGIWLMTPDLAYWRTNSFPVAFQNHAAGIVFSGSDITINAHGIGGVHGNGEAWYNDEQAVTRPGRPMPFVLWNVSNVAVHGFSVWQPPLWGFNIMTGSNIEVTNLYVNATARKAPWGKNWVQNTDGFDTMDVNNCTLSGLTYQGGDDCIAIKSRSYNIAVSNVTCRGGNGIAIGSLGQYGDDSSVVNVTVRDVRIKRYNEDMHNSAYIKTWIGVPLPQKGYESAGLPRGGGTGIVRNITFSNFEVEGADSGPSITQNSGNSNGSAKGTSKMEISQIVFEKFRGYLGDATMKKGVVGSVGCSKVKPCHDIAFKDIKLRLGKSATDYTTDGSCGYIAKGGVKGLSGGGCE
ncbi:glycoside hydrolase family protein [Venturia nashicola]|uniref:galacturonan 1,4-alpha-galacturonidase n=1 Tax=Venturia nashicola TaxID=86259 RepID=A0A4Z1PCH2_9PEZI|nr:glycoside hydrolase family 28 protein [Venturia nashicola]TLD38195.1 glycoside hydrolase family protein [Venturia nashicola]